MCCLCKYMTMHQYLCEDYSHDEVIKGEPLR